MLASRINITFGIITILLLLPYLFGWMLSANFDIWILIISLAFTGIPHGAIDHVIFLQQKNEPVSGQNLLKSFFTPYLLMIGFTFLLWLVIPAFMFWFFLVVAAYHFGQSQLFYISFPNKAFIKSTAYIFWGTFILSTLWLFHWQEQKLIIQSVFNWNLEVNGLVYYSVLYAAILSAAITLILLLYFFKNGMLTGRMFVQETLVLVLLTILFYITTPYLAFAVYFGLWHASRVIITEYHYLKMKNPDQLTFLSFTKSFLPFSILSFAGLGILFWVSQMLKANISPFMLFLIFISALTMPHAFFMERMYKFLNNNFTGREPAASL